MNKKRRHFGEFEQLLLYAVRHLQDDEAGASGPTIRRAIETHTKRTISPGAIYTALDRLERRGFVRSEFGDPTPERGGRAKRFYVATPRAVAALRDSRHALLALWRGLDGVLGRA